MLGSLAHAIGIVTTVRLRKSMLNSGMAVAVGWNPTTKDLRCYELSSDLADFSTEIQSDTFSPNGYPEEIFAYAGGRIPSESTLASVADRRQRYGRFLIHGGLAAVAPAVDTSAPPATSVPSATSAVEVVGGA